MTATVVPFRKKERVIDLRRELRLDLLDVLVLQEEIGGAPIPLCKILAGSTQNLFGRTLLHDTLRDLTKGELIRCEYGQVTVTELGSKHFYAHSSQETIVRREIVRVLREAPSGTHIKALHTRNAIQDACSHESQIDEILCELVDNEIIEWPGFGASLWLTGKGLTD